MEHPAASSVETQEFGMASSRSEEPPLKMISCDAKQQKGASKCFQDFCFTIHQNLLYR